LPSKKYALDREKFGSLTTFGRLSIVAGSAAAAGDAGPGLAIKAKTNAAEAKSDGEFFGVVNVS